MKLELVPPGCHRRNAAEVAIRNFKHHFLSVLAGTADDFPLYLWDRLLPQTEVTLNLLRQSNAIPTISAYAHLYGNFDFNKMPLAPMGCKVQVHEPTHTRGTWDYHAVDGWYLHTSDEHYRTHNCHIKSTRGERLSDTVNFLHKNITNPTIAHSDKIMLALHDLNNTIRNYQGPSQTAQQMRELKELTAATSQFIQTNRALLDSPSQQHVSTSQQSAMPPTDVNVRRSERVLQRSNPLPRVDPTATPTSNALPRVSPTAIPSSAPPPIQVAPTPLPRPLATIMRPPIRPTKSSSASPLPSSSGPASRTRSKTSAPRAAAPPSGPAFNTRSKKKKVLEVAAAVHELRGDSKRLCQRPSKQARKLAKRLIRVENEVHQAMAVMDQATGKMLNYRQLLKDPKYRAEWLTSAANEFGRLAQGIRDIKGTNTIHIIHKSEIPEERFKDVTYGNFVCTVRPEKDEKNRTRLTVGGDRINYPGEVATPTAEMLVAKILFNSVISTPGARFMTLDVGNFYLNTPLKRPEYLRIHIDDIPDEIIQEYNLQSKISNKYVYIKAIKGMYGLPHAGLIANELLEERLNAAGYFQSKLVPGLWAHESRKIQFSLVVDDFGVKYVQKTDAQHLESVLKEFYPVKTEWDGSRYIGIHLDWDYTRRQVHLSIPGYTTRALKQFNHPTPTKRQNAPFPFTPPNYGTTKQYAKEESDAPPLDSKDKRFIQQVCGKFLFLRRAIDSTLLVPISAIASQLGNPTTETMQQTHQLLDYIASQEEAILTYSASDMILGVHSDASYLSEPKARSRAGGHFFLSNNSEIPPNNGAILNIAHIIKHVMSSATEAELAALYIMAREAVYIRIILEELGHKQPPTPMQTDNAMAEAVINKKVQPKRTKAMDMRFHWLRDRECQQQFRFYWRPGKLNYADY